ncbi:MAG: hypothetical protein ACT4O9_00410 [Blastocatellia bacterium]
MPRRKQLKNIVAGLLGTFTSRNNDISGYWGLGLLRRYAENLGRDSLEIDLLSSVSDEPADAPLDLIEQRYRKWLSDAFAQRTVRTDEIKSAVIKLRFSTFEEFPNVERLTRGEPYACSVHITNAQGIEYSASCTGVCAPHDAGIELRSTRA